jgi:methylated-DNA-[protein]-cysteine S-methyltransferase
MSQAPDPGELLRSHGLRSTPQRRAILAAFEGGDSEHLAADEVHARASHSMPDLGRGTVYATLAEFTELGLLAALGVPEPVRYETNTGLHDHFRCRVCLRLFDLAATAQDLDRFRRRGFEVERLEVRADGICVDCGDYETGLTHGVKAVHAGPAAGDGLARRGVAATELKGPLGSLLLAASPDGLLRLAFEEHSDAGELRALAASRRGAAAARAHLDRAASELRRYLDGETSGVECEVDWEGLGPKRAAALANVPEIPFAARRSYVELVEEDLPPRRLGEALGANPVPIVVPCHRVIRGVEIPAAFVGGRERRLWLLEHERQMARRDGAASGG